MDELAEDVREQVAQNQGKRLVPLQITAIRESLGLSQSKIAKLTGYGKVSWNRWESGQTTPSASSDRMLRMLWHPAGRELALAVLDELSGVPAEEEQESTSPFSFTEAAQATSGTADSAGLRARFAGSRIQQRFPMLNTGILKDQAEAFQLRVRHG